MGRVRVAVSRVAAVLRRGKVGREIDEEVRAHLEMAEEEYRRRGLSAEEARLQALRDFGGVTQVREEVKLGEGWAWVEHVRRDVGYALRQMRRSPGFATVVVGTLALGIGAATAMFTVVDHVLLRPVPYKDAGRLMIIREGDGKTEGMWMGPPWLDVAQWMKESRSFEAIALSGGMQGRNYLQSNEGMLEVNGQTVSANLFPLLGVEPELGRGFLAEQPSFAPGKNAGTIILSDAVWKAAFGGDRRILGKVVKIDKASYTVVGVMPRGFRFPAWKGTNAQVWVPLELSKEDATRGWTAPRYDALARLRPGVSLAAAQAEMNVIQKRIAAEYTDPDMRKAYGAVFIARYGDTLAATDVRKALLALLAAAGILWLIAAVNVTNLLLARSTARQREIAMRGALGASRGRLMTQMLVEGLVLSGGAALLGAGLAVASVKALAHELAQRLPLPVPAMPDRWILLALLGLTMVSAVMASLWPAWMAARTPIEPALRQGGQQAGTGRRHHRMRGVLVSLEIALSLTLLVGCGLLLRTIYALQHVPLGYRTDHIVVAHISIPSYRFAGKNLTTDLYEPMLERVQHLHGIQSAGLMTEVPLGNSLEVQMSLYLKGRKVLAWLKGSTPGVEKVFGFRMAAGRYFNADDGPTSEPVMVVNEAFAREYSPDRHDPSAILGTKLLNRKEGQPMRIVGVLQDEHQMGADLPSQPEIEMDIAQMAPDAGFYQMMDDVAMDLAVRTDQPTKEMIPELRDVLRQANPELANSTITTMDEIVEDSYGSQRLAAHLLEIFGGVALLLCVAGLYGLLSYVVTQRTREMGVRVALGAPRGNLLWLILRQAGVMLVAGVAVGSGLAWATARLVRGFLFGVKAHDGWTLAGAAALLLGSGLLAAYLPARRAASVDPMEALRAE